MMNELNAQSKTGELNMSTSKTKIMFTQYYKPDSNIKLDITLKPVTKLCTSEAKL